MSAPSSMHTGQLSDSADPITRTNNISQLDRKCGSTHPRPSTKALTKLKTRLSGPWTVCAPPGNEIMIRITPMSGWQFKHSIVVAIDRLKLYTGEQPVEPHPQADLNMTGDEFAEELDPADYEWNNDHSVDLEAYKHLMPVLSGPSPYPDDTLDDDNDEILVEQPQLEQQARSNNPSQPSHVVKQTQCTTDIIH